MANALSQPSRAFVKNDDRAMTESAEIPRSKFIGTWTRNTTFDQGYLVPFLVEEVLPGDHLEYDVMSYLRMATPVFPMFDNLKISTFFFYVPNRLVWDNWRLFMGEQAIPNVAPAVTVPLWQSPLGGFVSGNIADHFGITAGISGGQVLSGDTISVNALPFRAYDLIFDQWFRDQNLENQLVIYKGDSITAGDPALRRRAKMHDYFTSCLPWPQKIVQPSVPLNGQIPVSGIGAVTNTSAQFPSDGRNFYESFGVRSVYPYSQVISQNFMRGALYNSTWIPDVFVDLTNGAGLDLRTLRSSMLIQAFYEKDARGGTRYTEVIREHFGVTSPDMRMQRPEYIGGGQQMMQLTPIAQTALGVSPLGTLGAAGTSVGSHSAHYASTEHGFIIGLMSVQSELSYQQGIPRMWSRQTRLDYYWPSLAELGEQAVLRKELYATGLVANDNAVFGYQERWAEYRNKYSEVTGTFRSTATGTLDAWHLGQKFTIFPVLNQAFIQDVAPMPRVLSAGVLAAGQQFLANILIKRTATRALPTYSTPATLGRF